ncbi:metallophosphoesterase [Fibrella aestuarina BUZ 2]|uniref:Metallophosphoesterase n=1 Tax=Fibrella aestuarina BUZ 2 TaxID=1166018 RepID=I0KGU4_9BACT|nr:metallophosphoesterase [Fibrella aestuarina]CCH03347.1 metallophosphoesterase [Fibrella aestuarina BUZ 2]
MNRTLVGFLLIGAFLLIDLYVYQAIRFLLRASSESTQRAVGWAFWGLSALTVATYLLLQLAPVDSLGRVTRTMLMSFVAITYFSKFISVIFLFIGDIVRFVCWIWTQVVGGTLSPSKSTTVDMAAPPRDNTITRSDFLIKTAVAAGTIPLVAFSYGIISGAHDYRIRRITLPLKNLPRSFDGLTIAQLSDIHSGSFFNKTAVKGGVDMLLGEKPDLVFFTGDLVNSRADEVNEYIDIFNKVKAPLGVFSTLGNHDYGAYVKWPSPEAQRQNVLNVVKAHKLMGWNPLMDENHILTQGGDKLAIIGVQNLGFGPAALRAGNLAKAYQGAADYPVKLLLSHDPTHWDAEIRPKFTDIDVTFSGHTHGAQFGVEVGDYKWSPVKYFYRQWAGLYTEPTTAGGQQTLYVNRGYGYIGYPGRVGILPEITIFTLKTA